MLAIHSANKRKTLLVVRIENRIPESSKLPIQEVEINTTKNANLYTLETDHRVLAYLLRLKKPRKMVLTDSYMYAFYSKNVKSLKIKYQDSNIKFVCSGNGKFAGLVMRKNTDKQEEVVEDE